MRRRGPLVIASILTLAGCAGSTTGGSAAPAAPALASSPSITAPSPASTPNSRTGATATPSASNPSTPPPPTSTPPTPTASATAPPTSVATEGTVVTTAGSQFGDILFDDTGQAIYLYDKETTTTPNCYDACAVAWPPVYTDGAPIADGAILADGLGTTTRTDGTVQVTYFDHPLYFYAGEGPREVTCHNVVEFGGLWLVVTPTGDPGAH